MVKIEPLCPPSLFSFEIFLTLKLMLRSTLIEGGGLCQYHPFTLARVVFTSNMKASTLIEKIIEPSQSIHQRLVSNARYLIGRQLDADEIAAELSLIGVEGHVTFHRGHDQNIRLSHDEMVAGLAGGNIDVSGNIQIKYTPELADAFQEDGYEFDCFSNALKDILNHELVHREQLIRSGNKATGDSPSQIFKYLGNKMELMAFAKSAVTQYRNLGHADAQILDLVRDPWHREKDGVPGRNESEAFWTYTEHFMPGDPEMKRFLSYMAKYLTKAESKIIESPDGVSAKTPAGKFMDLNAFDSDAITFSIIDGVVFYGPTRGAKRTDDITHQRIGGHLECIAIGREDLVDWVNGRLKVWPKIDKNQLLDIATTYERRLNDTWAGARGAMTSGRYWTTRGVVSFWNTRTDSLPDLVPFYQWLEAEFKVSAAACFYEFRDAHSGRLLTWEQVHKFSPNPPGIGISKQDRELMAKQHVSPIIKQGMKDQAAGSLVAQKRADDLGVNSVAQMNAQRLGDNLNSGSYSMPNSKSIINSFLEDPYRSNKAFPGEFSDPPESILKVSEEETGKCHKCRGSGKEMVYDWT